MKPALALRRVALVVPIGNRAARVAAISRDDAPRRSYLSSLAAMGVSSLGLTVCIYLALIQLYFKRLIVYLSHQLEVLLPFMIYEVSMLWFYSECYQSTSFLAMIDNRLRLLPSVSCTIHSTALLITKFTINPGNFSAFRIQC